MNPPSLASLSRRLRAALTDDLRRPPWRGCRNHLAGHCYVASEAAYHLLGGRRAGWAPRSMRHEGAVHWFLVHRPTGRMLDLTAGQFRRAPDHSRGTARGFLTRRPSARARELMRRVRAAVRNGARANPGQEHPLLHRLEALRPEMAAAAQTIYDDWEQDEEGEDCDLGTGGICDEIALALADVIGQAIPDAEVADGGQDGDDHAWIEVMRGRESYGVDIPAGVYERGGGYCWRRVPGVRFGADDVQIFALDPPEDR
jgi:hypothetical protein